jgi:putative flippase GtrA
MRATARLGRLVTLPLLTRMVSFAGAGGVATAFHYALLVSLVELGLLRPLAATSIAYALSAVLTYWLRRRFVFRSRLPHRQVVLRFLAAISAGFIVNGLVMQAGVSVLALPYGVAQLIATAVTLVLNFTVDQLWTFRDVPSNRHMPQRATSSAEPGVAEAGRVGSQSAPTP